MDNAQEADEPESQQPCTVLNVNDEDAIRYILTRVLKSGGYSVTEARTGQEGIDLAAQAPDLILLDVQLPDINGFQVCELLRAEPSTASIPVLMISANYVQPADIAAGIQCGAKGYLTHPVSAAVLLAAVKALLPA